MPNLRIEVQYANPDDWLALYIKPAENDTKSCAPEECASLDGWEPVVLRGGKGLIELAPGSYYYKYEAGNTPGSKIHIKLRQDNGLILEPEITISPEGRASGCGIFRIWEQKN